jgi:DNA (cytosine-5)-methyltransferase 1
MIKTFKAVDMFCGAGGTSTGIIQAAHERGMKVELLAINHWERAMETHAANHPGANHLCKSVESVDPVKVVKGGKLDLLWASPECVHHSIARGGRPRSDQGRASSWLILKWLQDLYISRVIIENVPEFLSWGPLDSSGRPIQKKKGETFRAFVTALKSLGYTVDWKILNCADYGDPTTRRRLFIQAVRGKKRILWPQITHMDGTENLMGYKPWIPARDIIDWTLPGTSIFDRKKPLADNTIRRIAAGIEKYWGDYAKPFLAILRGTSMVNSIDDPLSAITASGAHHALIEPVPLLMGHQSGQSAKPVDQPVHTILAQGRVNLIEPFITRFHGGEGSEKRNHSVGDPLPTLDTSNRYTLVEPFILPNEGFYRGNQARDIDTPLNTVTSRGAGALVEPLIVEYYGNGRSKPVSLPVGTITTKDHFGLLEPFMIKCCHSGGERTMSIDDPVPALTCSNENAIVQNYGLDIRFRMLKNHELKKAQGFPDDYKITGNVTEQTKQIGNAVPVNTAKALTLAAMA